MGLPENWHALIVRDNTKYITAEVALNEIKLDNNKELVNV